MFDEINKSNPWKAFLPYDEKSAFQFKGRDRNREELFAFVERERATVCYADSGVGKSSLINAGLKPKLRQHLFFPVDIVFTEADYASGELDFDKRVIQELEKEIAKRNEQSQEVKFRLKEFVDVFAENIPKLDEKLSVSSLWWLLHTRKIECSIMGNHVADYSPIFIFDQFEELFTRSQHEHLIQSFFEWYPTVSSENMPSIVENEVRGMKCTFSFSQLLRHDTFKFLFSLRQDSMGTFDYWVTQRYSIPSLRGNRYCLLPLTTEQAYSVITEQGVDTLNGVSKDIIDELKDRNSDSVPAIMLSVFCNRLYETARTGLNGEKKPVEREDVSTNKDILIREYYEELLAKTGIDENTIFIIEDCLVSDTGKRNRIVNGSSESLESIHFDEKYRRILAGYYLINDKGEYVEIAHDKVAEAVFLRKKERKLRRNLRKWRFMAFLIPLFLLLFSIVYATLPNSRVDFFNEFYIGNEYLSLSQINEKQSRIESSVINNSLLKNILINSEQYFQFSGCSNLQKVKIEQIKHVGDDRLRFADCLELEQIDLSESVISIGDNFLENCPKMKYLKIPKAVTEISPYAFRVEKLIIDVDTANNYFVWDNGILWDKNKFEIIYIQEEILASTNKIPFLYGANRSSLEYRGRTFYPLDPYHAEILVNKDSTELLPYVMYKFYKCIDLSAFTKIKEIPANLFKDCVVLESVVFPPNLRKIGFGAFRECIKLKELSFPKSLRTIEESAFEFCCFLENINLQNKQDITIGQYAFPNSFTYDENIPIHETDSQLRFEYQKRFLGKTFFLKKRAWAYGVKYDIISSSVSSPRYDVIMFNDSKTECIHFPNNTVCSTFKIYTPSVNLKELHLADYQPDAFLEGGDSIIYPRHIRIDIPTFMKKNIILYVPYGCLDYYKMHPDFQGYKAIMEDGIWLRVWNVVDRYINGIIRFFDWRWGMLAVLGCIVLVGIVYLLGRSIDKVLGVKKKNVTALLSACLFTLILTPICFMGGYWCIYVFVENEIISTVVGIILCLLMVLILAIMQRMTPKELWKKRKEIQHYLWGLTKLLWMKLPLIKLLMIIVVLLLGYYMYRNYRVRLENYRTNIVDKCNSHRNSKTPFKAYSIAYEGLTKKTYLNLIDIWPNGYKLNGHHKRINSASFSLDGKLLVTASSDNTANLWKVKSDNATIIDRLKGHTKSVNSASFSSDAKYLVTASSDNTAILWKVESDSATIIDRLKGHTKSVNSASFSPDGKYIVTASSDETAILWRFEKERVKVLDTLKGHLGGVNSASFSPDGEYIVTASSDETAILWRFEKSKVEALDTLRGHKRMVNSAIFSPDGKYIVTASGDDIAILWSIENPCKALQDFKAHEGDVNFASFSSDSRSVVTASSDNTVIIWDIEGRVQPKRIGDNYECDVNSVSFSSDGNKLVVSLDDGSIMLWSGESLLDVNKRYAHAKEIAKMNPLTQDEKKELGFNYDKWAFPLLVLGCMILMLLCYSIIRIRIK